MAKILIIEDEQVLRRLTSQLLRLEGYETIEAEDGNAGVTLASSSLPDLIVCDIMMPGLDGFGVLQALRTNPPTAMIPFIFLTALVSNADLRHGMEEGADDYITKPYAPPTLLGSVRRRLEKRHRQLAETRQRAEEVSLAVAAAVPQEILEPLDHIVTVVSLLALKYAPQDPQIAAMHQSITQESARLRRLLRRLHLYAQLPALYANRFELLKHGPVLTGTVLVDRAARQMCRHWNREADLVFVWKPKPLPLNSEYLALLVEELVDNACKFSTPGTPITVYGCGRREFWSLTVSNHGPGLGAEQIGQIAAFKQFLHGNKKPEGLGLGLALTQGIARLHGCEFSIKSEGDTTTATILVPLES